MSLCGDSSHVIEVGVPTVALLLPLAPVLGLGALNSAMAAALVTTYRITDKRIYKCTRCDKHYVA